MSRPPPYYYRSFQFDDGSPLYSASPDGSIRLQNPVGNEGAVDDFQADQIRQSLETFLMERSIASDRNIPQTAGPLLDERLVQRLGEPWNRSEFIGYSLHAVEHFRFAEALVDAGYPALAVAELNAALAMEKYFPEALFFLAKTYASMDPKGAEKYFRKFLHDFGDLPRFADRAEEARRYLQN